MAVSVSVKGGSLLRVYASVKNPRPSSPLDSDKYTEKSSQTLMMLPYDLLKDNKFLYLGFICDSPLCETTVSIGFAKEFEFIVDDYPQTYFPETLEQSTAAVFKIKMPESAKNADRIVIHAEAIPMKALPEFYLQMYILQGNEAPDKENHGHIKKANYLEGITALITREDSKCLECDYTVTLHFPEGAGIQLKVNIFGPQVEIGAYRPLIDAAHARTTNTYIYRMGDEEIESNVVFYVKRLVGEIEAYIECDKLPKKLEDYTYHHKLERFEEIVITQEEHSRCQTSTFYLTIKAIKGSAYFLRIWNKKDHFNYLMEGSTATGDIMGKEKLEYEFYVPHSAAEQIKVHVNSKGKLNADLISCRFPSECPGLMIIANNNVPIDTVENRFVFDTIDTDLGQTLTVKNDKNGCWPVAIDSLFYSQPIIACAYKLIVTSLEERPYEYEIKLELQGHQPVYPGYPTFGVISGENEWKYYMLYIPNNAEDISQISIQLTTISGHVEMYVSQYFKYPKDDETSLYSHEGLIYLQPEAVPYLRDYLENLNGTYYIGVKSQKSSSYYITATIYSKTGEQQDFATTLKEGVPQKGLLLPNKERESLYYKFHLNKPEDWDGYVLITLNSLNGQLILYATDEEGVPMTTTNRWESHDNRLVIDKTNPFFKSKGTYYVTVSLDVLDPVTRDQQVIVFYIDYTVHDPSSENDENNQGNKKHKTLASMFPYSDQIERDEIMYFQFFANKGDDEETISIKSDGGAAQIFLALDGNKYPNPFEFTLTNGINSELTIFKDQLNDYCKTRWVDDLCPVYFSIVTFSETPVRFTLSLLRKRDTSDQHIAPVMLAEGIELLQNIPKEGTPALFYYYPTLEEDAVITVTCPNQQIAIYANKRTTVLAPGVDLKIEYPSETSHDYAVDYSEQKGAGFNYLTIPASSEYSSYVITIAVYFKPNLGFALATPTQPTFTITASSSLITINSGYSYFGAVEKNSYIYYLIWVNQPDCTILITMTTLAGGDPDLYVSYGKNSRPTVSNHQFAASTKLKTEVLEISPSDAYPRESMEGPWVIGVYGVEPSAFTLTVVYEDQKIITLTQGTPSELYLKEQHNIYFKYYHKSDTDFNIHLDVQSGEVLAVVGEALVEGDIYENLPTEDQYLWKFDPKLQSSELRISKGNAGYCWDCTYLILVKGIKSSKFSISITSASASFTLQNGLVYDHSLEPRSERTYIFNGGQEDVYLTLLSNVPGLEVYVSHNPLVSKTIYTWKLIDGNNLVMKKDTKYRDKETDGKTTVVSQPDIFYIRFINTNSYAIGYSFSVYSNSAYQVLKDGYQYPGVIAQSSSVGYMYYCPEDAATIDIILEFAVQHIELFGLFESKPMRGLDVKVLYWPEKLAAGPGREVPILENRVMIISSDTTTKKVNLKQTVMIKAQKGRFEFLFDNPFSNLVEYQVLVKNENMEFVELDRDSYQFLSFRNMAEETIKFTSPRDGVMFVDVNRCDGDFDLYLAKDISEFETRPSKTYHIYDDESVFFKSDISKGEVQYINVDPKSFGDGKYALVKINVLNKGALPNIENIQPGNIETVSLTIAGSKKGYLDVKFSHLEFQNFDYKAKGVDIQYHLSICPNPAEADISTVCSIGKIDPDCAFAIEENPVINSIGVTLPPTAKSKSLTLSLAAVVVYEGRPIRTIPYHSKTLVIHSKGPEFPFGWLVKLVAYVVLVFVAIVVAILAWKYFKKVDTSATIELQMIANKRKGYGIMDVDEH